MHCIAHCTHNQARSVTRNRRAFEPCPARRLENRFNRFWVNTLRFSFVPRDNYRPPSTTSYASASKPSALSSLSIADSIVIQDLNITLKVANAALQPLAIKLYAPDGTVVNVAANDERSGILTYHVISSTGKNVTGIWQLEVDGLADGALNSTKTGCD